MSFDSVFFISCFLPIALALYFVIPKVKYKNVVLLITSFVFYAFGSFTGLAILLALVLVNFGIVKLIETGKFKKLVLIIGVALDLSVLCFFKYLNFLLTDLLGLPKLDIGLAAPLGVSFLIFKAISLLIDSYRNKTNGKVGLFRMLLYVSFFPQVTAGPIARYEQFESQLSARSTDLETVTFGIRRFVVGLAKKVILCGSFGFVVDKIFAASPTGIDYRLAWLGAISYMLQIYFDFSGYSDMAIGISAMFGILTPENFNYPYIADSIGNFWRRWHISLSSWFKDYLYIPLGGSRKGRVRTALNKVIVFTFCGFWHGANWNFMVWGLWHGLWSGVESIFAKTVKKLNENRFTNVLMHIYTLFVVMLGFVMFRADSLASGWSVISAMFTGTDFSAQSTLLLLRLLNAKTVTMLILGIFLSMPVLKSIQSKRTLKILTPLSLVGCLLLFVVCILSLAAGGFAPFIYAQF